MTANRKIVCCECGASPLDIFCLFRAHGALFNKGKGAKGRGPLFCAACAPDKIRAAIASNCRIDPETKNLARCAPPKEKPARPAMAALIARKILDADRQNRRPPGRPKTVDIEHRNINGFRPTGTSAAAALRRLERQRPDLLDRVLAGALSAHSAMIEAGFRKRP
jgi:hypothetical protein